MPAISHGACRDTPPGPVARVGLLAIDKEFQRQRLGAAMLRDAANRALRAEMGEFAFAVAARGKQASAFYRRFEFVAIESKPLHPFLPPATIASL